MLFRSNLLQRVIPEHLANENSLIATFTTSEKEQLTTLLRKWLIALEADASDGPLLHLGMVLLHPRTSLMKRRAVGLPDVPGFLVHAVEPGSWADETGFRKGDLIRLVEGRTVDSLVELRRVLNLPRPRIKRFSIRRGTEAIEL